MEIPCRFPSKNSIFWTPIASRDDWKKTFEKYKKFIKQNQICS